MGICYAGGSGTSILSETRARGVFGYLFTRGSREFLGVTYAGGLDTL